MKSFLKTIAYSKPLSIVVAVTAGMGLIYGITWLIIEILSKFNE